MEEERRGDRGERWALMELHIHIVVYTKNRANN